MQKIPRELAFDANNVCVAAGCPAVFYWSKEGYTLETIAIPTDHYDFIGVNVVGKTLDEIKEICDKA